MGFVFDNFVRSWCETAATTPVRKTPNAWPRENSTNKRTHSTGKMHDSRASKIDEIDRSVNQWRGFYIRVPVAHETISGPYPMDNDRVYKRSDDKRINEICRNLDAFCNCTAHDRCSGGSKRPLEEKVSVTIPRLSSEKEVRRADEEVARFICMRK